MSSSRGTGLEKGNTMLGYYNYTVWLTFLGFFSGVMGLFAAAGGRFSTAVLLLGFSGVCDMFDGIVARTRKRTDEEQRFGIQLDSLSDLVCFCVLPAFIGWNLGLHAPWQSFALAAFALSGLIRLAYFNVAEETRQKQETGVRKGYEGMPVTTMAIWVPLLWVLRGQMGEVFPLVYLGLLVLCGFLFLFRRLRVPKLKLKQMLFLMVVGAMVVLALILGRA